MVSVVVVLGDGLQKSFVIMVSIRKSFISVYEKELSSSVESLSDRLPLSSASCRFASSKTIKRSLKISS